MILQWLLEFSSKETFKNYFVEISKYIFKFRENENTKIKKSVIESLPIIAKYDPEFFVKKLLDMNL